MNTLNVNFLGKLYDWGSANLNILGSNIIGCDSVDIKHTQESKNIYGSGQLPIGYYNMNEEFDMTVGFLYDQFSQITKAALDLGLTPMQIPPFSAELQLGSTQDPLVPYQSITVLVCRFTSNNFVAKQNSGGWYNQYNIRCCGITRVL